MPPACEAIEPDAPSIPERLAPGAAAAASDPVAADPSPVEVSPPSVPRLPSPAVAPAAAPAPAAPPPPAPARLLRLERSGANVTPGAGIEAIAGGGELIAARSPGCSTFTGVMGSAIAEGLSSPDRGAPDCAVESIEPGYCAGVGIDPTEVGRSDSMSPGCSTFGVVGV